MDLTIARSYCIRRDDSDARVEYFWSTPSTAGRAPCIVLLHGHNMDLRYGARTEFLTGLHEYFADNGFVTASVSQPGYGGSSGPPDYCGPGSWSAVSSVLDALLQLDAVDPGRVTAYGLSRGATIALMTATVDPRISGVIAVAPLCDFVEGHAELNPGIREALATETDGSREALSARSPHAHVDRIASSVLMLHGEDDDVAPFAHAEKMHRRARQLGKDFELERLPGFGHGLPFHLCGRRALEFLSNRGLGSQAPARPYCLSFDPTPSRQ